MTRTSVPRGRNPALREIGPSTAVLRWVSLSAVATIIATTLGVGPVAAQRPSVRAHMDPAEVDIGESFRVIIEVSGVKEIEDVFIPPVFPVSGRPDDGLLPFTTEILTPGPGQSGGVVTFAYSFVAKTAGSIEIGPVLVTADGHALESGLLMLSVKDPETVTVRAHVEPAVVRVMEEFEVHVEVVGVGSLLESPVLPDLSHFASRSGVGRGRGTASFRFVALESGAHEIGPVSVKVGSNVYLSEPLTVAVSDEPPPMEVTVSLNTGQPWVGGKFGLQVEVVGASSLDEDPVLPDMSGFAEITDGFSGGGSGSRMVNGIGRPFVSEVYQLQAVASGEFEIGPVRVTAGGHTAFSEPLRVTIGEQAPQPEVSREDLRVSTSIDKRRVYVGEQAILSYQVLSREPLWSGDGAWRSEYSGLTLPPLENFRAWETRLRRATWERISVDGRAYQPGGGASVVLVPLEPGETTVGPAEFRVQIHQEERSISGPERHWAESMGNWALLTLATDPVSIEVLPLPMGGRPESFRGHVGKLELVCWVDRTDARVGDTVTMHVELAGDGHSRFLPDPEIVFPEGFEVPEAEISHTDARADDSSPSGTRVYIYRLVANRVGSYRIPVIEVSWFDAESESYETSRAGPLDLNVFLAGREYRR